MKKTVHGIRVNNFACAPAGTPEVENEQELRYWCNGLGEAVQELDAVHEELLSHHTDGSGSYCYVADYKGEPGLLYIIEYHELDSEGQPADRNNYEQALAAASKLRAWLDGVGDKGTRTAVFINRASGIPSPDPATELCVFLPQDVVGEAWCREVEKWLLENAYS